MTQLINLSASLRVAAEARSAMQARATMATEEFYSKSGRAIPTPAPTFRFQIKNKAKAFHIYDRKSGRVVGFCFSYRAALVYADAMERGAAQRLVPRRLNS
ncbi:hypothetical protein IFR09_11160 [Pseudomonas syringae]|uniref:hypothetical protein n=1 Tax=Pseudomonas ovata TaxID=1839709 RepID=UPI000D69561F|nr:hypothetical protein [Pseudomonas ovata]MBD8492993.1 hypothetical protein [Pseudomonas syringae]MBD8790937.1 hypothetical protein [Pseudomonas syringae]MBD8801927.1 hypothetical protein [Pseudomonas syringae]MBD8811723.1 hypothetical protein [Pseudomonas syringae]